MKQGGIPGEFPGNKDAAARIGKDLK